MNEGVVGGRDYLRTVLDAIPAPLFVIDGDLLVRDANRAAVDWAGGPANALLKRLCGDVLRCRNALATGKRCGETEACPDCVVRTGVNRAMQNQATVRQKASMALQDPAGRTEAATLLVSASPFEHCEHQYALVILEDITELMELRRLLPVCARCRRVRDDDDLWQSVEGYLARHTNVELSHGLCPDCMKELYPDQA